MSFPSFPGQNNQAPVAPTPVAGGFAPVAPQAHVPPQGFAPQPGGGFTGQAAAAAAYPAYAAHPAAQPQAFAPQGYGQPQPQATQALASQADFEALRGAQMGKGKRERLPVGDYVVVGEATEFFDANAAKGGVPNRALALQIVVEESSNPTIKIGSRAKTTEFFDTSFKKEDQLNKFKQFCGRLYGVQSQEQLDSFDWVTPCMAATSDVFRGARYQIKVTRVLDRSGRVKLDKRGEEVTRDSIQRIG
jgi:hypothetical protein